MAAARGRWNKHIQRATTARLLLPLVVLLAALAAEARAWRPFDALEGPRHFSDYFQPPPAPFMQNIYAGQPLSLAAPFAAANQQQQQQQSQLLTPMSSAHGGPLSVQPQQQQFVAAVSPTISTSHQEQQQQQQQQQQQPPPTQAQQEAQQEFSRPHQLDAREAPPQQEQAPVAGSSGGSQAAPAETLDGRDVSRTSAAAAGEQPKQAPPEAPSAGELQRPQPSPFGKILDAAPVQVGGANGSSALEGAEGKSAGAIALQMLKPRRPGGEGRKAHTPASIEQQIIDQHARAAAGYNSHSSQYATSAAGSTTKAPALVQQQQQAQQQQRLSPATKNRGAVSSSGGAGKSLGALLFNSLGVLAGASPDWSTSASSSSVAAAAEQQQQQQQQTSPISALMSNFKSGISSRSSIMKAAISDNKLARTLTTVSKTLGGNKYVAGAGIAAALAALGLTMGKYLSPYSLSSGPQYSKLGEPLLSAGSYMAPAFSSFPGANERQLALAQSSANGGPAANFLDALAAAATSNSGYETPSYNGAVLDANYPQQQQQFEAPQAPSVAFDQVALSRQAAAAGLYPANQHMAFAPAAPPPGVYQPQQQQQQLAGSQVYLRPAGGQRWSASQAAKQPFDSANGHYSNFYSLPEIDAASSAAAAAGDEPTASGNSMMMMSREQQQQQQQQQAANRQFGTYLSGEPSATFAGNPTFGYAGSPEAGSLQEAAAGMGQQQASELQLQANFDQMPAASLDAPSYQKAPQARRQQQQAFNFNKQQAGGAAPRRSGAVTLKLDESTRSRLEQQLTAAAAAGGQRDSLVATQRPQATANYNYFALNAPVAQTRATRQERPFAPVNATNRQWSATSASPSKLAPRERSKAAASGGPIAPDGGQQPWRQATQGEPPKQSATGYQFIKPAGDEQRNLIVFGSLNAAGNELQAPHAKGARAQQAADRGWKSIEENNEVDGVQAAAVATTATTGASLSPLSQAFEYAQADEPMPAASVILHQRLSRTQQAGDGGATAPTSNQASRRQPSEEERLASEQLQQLALLIDQQRALDQQQQQQRRRQADHTSASEAAAAAVAQREPDGGHLFVAANSIRDKSVEMGGKSNEVVKPKTTAVATAAAAAVPTAGSVAHSAPQDNRDKTPKPAEEPLAEDNKQLDAQQRQQQQQQQQQQPETPGDNVVVEVIDAAELFGAGAEPNATAAKQTTGPAATGGEAAAAAPPMGQQRRQQQQQENADNEGEQGESDELVGKPRAYRGLVAGSLGGAN